MITRRKLLCGLSAFIAAPAIIRVADMMPIRAFQTEILPFVLTKGHGFVVGDFINLRDLGIGIVTHVGGPGGFQYKMLPMPLDAQ